MADTKISALTAKTYPIAADITNILDSAATNADKRVTLGDIQNKYVSYTATCTAKDVVYMAAAGTAAAARGNALATMYAVGFASETKSAAACVIQTAGIVTIAAPTLTPGLPVYISKDTAGLVTHTPPSTVGEFVQVVGVALSATTILIQIGPVITVGAAVLGLAAGGTNSTDYRAATETFTNKRISPRIVYVNEQDATLTSGNTEYNTDNADEFVINGMYGAIALCTELRTDIIAHFANVADQHATAQSTATIGAVPTNFASLLVTAGTLLSLYDAHNTDMINASPTYHSAQGTTHALTSAATPTTLAQAVTRLNDLKAKYNLHEAETTGHKNHASISANQTATADAVVGLAQATDFAAPGGTPTRGQKLIIKIRDDSTARALTFVNTAGAFRFGATVTEPTTTTDDCYLILGCMWDEIDGIWDVVATDVTGAIL